MKAYDIETRRIVYAKDYWRTIGTTLHPLHNNVEDETGQTNVKTDPAAHEAKDSDDRMHKEGQFTKEGDVYTLLKKANVSNILPFGHGNDILGHTTIGLGTEMWARGACLRQLQQYRMTLKVVAVPLKDFSCTKHLVKVVAGAMEGEST